MEDEKYMQMSLRLAARAKGRTSPNPMVGALLVRNGRVVGKGYHRRAGGPHAEVNALRQAGRLARGSTLYVNLEPCRHFGRTPPCTDAILKAGVRRVVAAMVDPNSLNQGRGLRKLRSRGIRTTLGILENEARTLNKAFVTRMKRGRPFVTVKVAISLDGKIATKSGESQWISSPRGRKWAQALRSRMDALLVGVETILKDNPRLTVRLKGYKQPLKVILDSRLRTPPTARIFDSRAPVLIATTRAASRSRERKLRQSGAEVMRFSARGSRADLRALLRELAHREVTQLLIEGGGEVIASAFSARVVDQAAFVIAPLLIGGREAPTAFEGEGITHLRQAISLKNMKTQCLGQDLLITADV